VTAPDFGLTGAFSGRGDIGQRAAPD